MTKEPEKVYIPVCHEKDMALCFSGMLKQVNAKRQLHQVFVASYMLQTLLRCQSKRFYKYHVARYFELLKFNPSLKNMMETVLRCDTLIEHVECLPESIEDSEKECDLNIRGRVGIEFTFVVIQPVDDDELSTIINNNDEKQEFDVHVIQQLNYNSKKKNAQWKETRAIIKSYKNTFISYYLHPKVPLMLVSYLKGDFVVLTAYEIPVKEIASIYLPLVYDSSDNISGVIDASINANGMIFAAATTTDIYIVHFGDTGDRYRIAATFKQEQEQKEISDIISCIQFSTTNPTELHVGTRQGHMYSIRLPNAQITFHAMLPNITPILDMHGSNERYLVAHSTLEIVIFDRLNGHQTLIGCKNHVTSITIVHDYLYALIRDGDLIGIPLPKDSELPQRAIPSDDLMPWQVSYPEEWYRAMRYDEKDEKLYVVYPDGRRKTFTIKK